MFMHGVCLSVWPSPVWRSSRTEQLSTDAPLSAWSLGLRSECQALCVFVVCMCIDEHMPVCVCVCVCMCACVFVGVNESEGCQPCPEQPREMWHKEATEQARERVCLCLRVCVHFLNASLTVVVYERGLVLVEQMAEC